MGPCKDAAKNRPVRWTYASGIAQQPFSSPDCRSSSRLLATFRLSLRILNPVRGSLASWTPGLRPQSLSILIPPALGRQLPLPRRFLQIPPATEVLTRNRRKVSRTQLLPPSLPGLQRRLPPTSTSSPSSSPSKTSTTPNCCTTTSSYRPRVEADSRHRLCLLSSPPPTCRLGPDQDHLAECP